MISTESSRSSAQRKRQRLDQLVDRIAHFVSSSSNGSGTPVAAMERPREVLRGSHLVSRLRVNRTGANARVFNFDHVAPCSETHHLHISDEDGEEEVFSPLATTFSDRLTLSPCSSSTVDSPSGISFSPLSFDDADLLHSKLSATCSSDDQCLCAGTPLNLSKASSRVTDGAISPPCSSSSPFCPAHRCHRQVAAHTPGLQAPVVASSAACSRRRARSDSDLRDSAICLDYPPPPVATWVVTPATVVTSISHLNTPPSGTPGHSPTSRLSRLEHLRPPPLIVSLKRSSTDSDSSSPLFQESPVDLSIRSGSSVSSTDSPNQTSGTSIGSSVDYLETPIRFSTSSLTSSTSSSRSSKLLTRSLSLSQYLSADYGTDLSVDASDSSTASMAPPTTKSAAFHCDVCGQGFDLHDRLIKHLASRHKSSSRAVDSGATSVVKGYQCDVCQRPFARSDMLTRHMRLHTGLKPYTCRICGQVFSRSDHLSTHQRTHTGEKPYRCPQCAYAACRRDMITRHLRTHTRSEDLDQIHDSRKDSTG